MARRPPPQRLSSVDAVQIDGLAEYIREARRVKREHGIDGTKGLSKANFKAAQLVVDRAQSKAASIGGMERLAAKSMKAGRRTDSAVINAGGKKAEFFGGAEFGAYRNRRRLKKNTQGLVKDRTIRKTIVRDDEDIRKVIQRVESQTVALDRYGGLTNVNKRFRGRGGIGVKVTGVVLGWNQFKTWRGNDRGAGYWLYPTIRSNTDDIRVVYEEELEQQLRPLFPD